MLNEEQRRNNNPNSSRLPIPATTKHRHITTESTVTPTKLVDNKNNNKSRLFSTTCSRMAQEVKNYNKRPIINNKNLSSFYLSPQQKMNLNNNKKNTTLTPPKKPATPVTPTTLRKSALVILKQDLERLRQKKLDDESLILKQSIEIADLKKKLTRTAKTELEFQLSEKSRLKEKLASITAQAKTLSIDVVDLLEVKNSASSQAIYEDEIIKLQTQLEIKEEDFKKKLENHVSIAKEMDKNIQQNNELETKLKLEHTIQLNQLKSSHLEKINKMETEHEQDMKKSRLELNRLEPSSFNLSIDKFLEQALLEFEQEQHNHIPNMIQQQDSNQRSIQGKVSLKMKNQQWYANRYLPTDAITWPKPQPLSNLNRTQHHIR